MQWIIPFPINKAPAQNQNRPKEQLSTIALFVLLGLVCGLFSGTFAVALLFRRIAIALAIAGPLIFSLVWMWKDWNSVQARSLVLGAIATGFTLTFLALDRAP